MAAFKLTQYYTLIKCDINLCFSYLNVFFIPYTIFCQSTRVAET